MATFFLMEEKWGATFFCVLFEMFSQSHASARKNIFLPPKILKPHYTFKKRCFEAKVEVEILDLGLHQSKHRTCLGLLIHQSEVCTEYESAGHMSNSLLFFCEPKQKPCRWKTNRKVLNHTCCPLMSLRSQQTASITSINNFTNGRLVHLYCLIGTFHFATRKPL